MAVRSSGSSRIHFRRFGIRFYSVTRSYPKLFRRHGHGRREALISPITHADGGMAMVLALTRMANGGMAMVFSRP